MKEVLDSERFKKLSLLEQKNMRRTLFYLSVALLAFGIGSLFAVELYWARSIDSITGDVPSVQEKVIFACPILPATTKFSCEDEAAKTVWEKLEKDKRFIDDAQSVIEMRQIKNCQELFYDQQKVDLNNDNSDEIILKGSYTLFCNSGADCQTWIVSKINNRYKIIFESTAGESFEDIQFLQESTHKFQNLRIKLNNHWEADTFGFFKFDGKQYRINKCIKDVNSNYDYDDIYPEKLVSVDLKQCS